MVTFRCTTIAPTRLVPQSPAVILRPYEAAVGGITSVVHATVRGGAAVVPGAPDRIRGLAHRRSLCGRGDQAQDLRCLPGDRAPGEGGKAGHHYRRRRKEPGETWPVALAA